jgi:predicted nucleic acid-binding OB-fold protein
MSGSTPKADMVSNKAERKYLINFYNKTTLMNIRLRVLALFKSSHKKTINDVTSFIINGL